MTSILLPIILGLVFSSSCIIFIAIGSYLFPEARPKLQVLDQGLPLIAKKKRRLSFLGNIAIFNQPLCIGPLGQRMSRDLSLGRVDLSPEEFLFIKEAIIVLLLFLTSLIKNQDMMIFLILISFMVGYYFPELWLKNRISKIKILIIKELPSTIDLLGLCVNAGLDFLLSLKWVVEKSRPSPLIDELSLIMQEISLGKTRRVALRDFSKKYELPDVSTFTRTLIQADRMGTSVAEAFNILSEDMRESRFKRGEQIALKAPLKMLIPLLLFIFPVVIILVGAPILLTFTHDNALSQIGGGLSGK